MNYKTFSSEGFVIKRTSYKEADRIITLYCRDFGKITLIAKGVRKLTSRKRGGIEIFNQVKFSAIVGRGFDIMTEVSLLNGYDDVRLDLGKVSVGYYFCEVINKVTQENEKHSDLYEILIKYFEKLNSSRNLKKLRMDFVRDVLITVGFWPVGKKMDNPDLILENVIERKMSTSRVGKKMLQPN